MSKTDERQELADRFRERIDEPDAEIDERVGEGKESLKKITSGVREKAGEIGNGEAGSEALEKIRKELDEIEEEMDENAEEGKQKASEPVDEARERLGALEKKVRD